MFYTLNWADKKTNKMQGKQGKAGRGKGRKGNRNVNGNWKLVNGKWKMVQRAHARWEVKVKRIKIGIKMALRSRVVSFLAAAALPRDAFYEWIRGRDLIDTKLLQYKRIADDRGASREGSSSGREEA